MNEPLTLTVTGYQLVREDEANYLNVRFKVEPTANFYKELDPQAAIIHRQFKEGTVILIGVEDQITFTRKNNAQKFSKTIN
jgi:glutamine amidotransferase-like uncharacterized protein